MIFIASGAGVNVYYPDIPREEEGLKLEPDHEGALVSRPVELKSDTVPVRTLPLPHKSEIQSLSVCASDSSKGSLRLACSDSSGVTSITIVGNTNRPVENVSPTRKRRRTEEGFEPNTEVFERMSGAKTIVLNSDAKQERVEPGYNGVCLSGCSTAGSENSLTAGVVSYWGKSISTFTQERLATRHYCSQRPTQLRFLPQNSAGGGSGNVLCATEGNIMSVWDVRTAKGCAQYMPVGQGALLALACLGKENDSNGNYVAVGGVERSCHIFDSRMWKSLCTVQGVTKYEITALRGSALIDCGVYIGSLDHEVLLCDWYRSVKLNNDQCKAQNSTKNQRKAPPKQVGKSAKEGFSSHLTRQGLRGDSRWIGLDVASGGGCKSENLVGMTDSGRLYVIRDSWRMAGVV